MAQERKSKAWTVYADPDETEERFRARVEQELVDIFPLAYRGGRGVIVAPLRRQVWDEVSQREVYVTIGFAFEEVFMPGVASVAASGAASIVDEPEDAVAAAAAAEPVEA